ncbi:MAG: hydrogenase formation protein HypD [Desulfovibrionales bacterium]
MDLLQKLKDPELCRSLIQRIEAEVDGTFRFMEVCGTHTVAIFQSGLRSLLSEKIVHVSGPGCPVCVTHESEVAAFLEVAARPDVILVTFGDLMRVPGPGGKTLKLAQAQGARIQVVYSPFDSLAIAAANPDSKVVFLGVGFETTAPTIAATLKVAREQGVKNFFVLSFHKVVPPALSALVQDPQITVQGFLLPGHVSAIIGLEPYRFIAQTHSIPAVISGFEPVDILQSLLLMIRQRNEGKAEVVNNYKRIVADAGNPKAQEILAEVFTPVDALWRGIGLIPGSGLALSKEYQQFDGLQELGIEIRETPPIKGCRCGDVLKGVMPPDKCPLFGKACTPASPVGPCMVSTEGSCAAYFKYKLD